MSKDTIVHFVDKAERAERRLATSRSSAAEAIRTVIARTEAPPEPTIDQVPAFSDDWLALSFTARHGHDLRYCALWGKWLHWDGTRWEVDETKKIFDLVRKLLREVAVECNDLKASKQIASSKTVAAVKTMAESDRQHATHSDDWDADLWLLNTPTCTVDLRTGEKREHSQGDYITRITSVGPGGECPNWLAFLDRVTAGNKDLQSFLQRVVGYALTGTTIEHALFFLYGTGANGKSVFLNTIKGILAEYQKTAPIETFIESHNDKHPTDLAGLRGARTVTAVETEQGRRWAESKIKMLTGGDRVSARFMRQDFFEFTPQFKLLIAGNHKPTLRSVDEAIKRRFNLIPFTVTIPPEERDPKLTEKLESEWPGILQWMIDGCLEWQRIGLAAPEIVTEATNAYLESEDAVRAWIDERCERDLHAFEPRPRLYESWSLWAEKSGEKPGSAKFLYEKLEAQNGVHPHKRDGIRGFIGLQIKPLYGAE
jgi:putative DNA primase/helicase